MKLSRASFGMFVAAVVALVGPAAPSSAQEPAPDPAATQEPPKPVERPGMWSLGPFWLTPKFRIGTIGLDTNVLYTPTERTTDISASGGPGLEIVLPLGRTGRFYTEGFLDYLYFVKTESQRRLTGNARGGVNFEGTRSSLVLEEYWNETYVRPTFEVNQRVQQWTEGTRLDFMRRLFGRISLTGVGERRHQDTGDGTDYLGTDLTRTLTSDSYRAGGGLSYALSVKTSFVVEYEYDWYRYPLSLTRDADSNQLMVGFRTDETALIVGRFLVGQRKFNFKNSPVEQKGTVYDIDGSLKLGPKTRIGGIYSNNFAYSALPTVGLNPLMTQEVVGARFERDLAGNVDLRLRWTQTWIKTEDPVAVDVPSEGPVLRKRDDKYQFLTADLGYRFRPRLRIGIAASYGDQNTTIDYFGVEGFVVGLTVRYNP